MTEAGRPPETGSPLRTRLRRRARRSNLGARAGPLIALLGLAGAVSIGHPLFLSAYGLNTLASAASVIMLLAAGQFLPISIGSIDLSMGALTAFGTVLLALWLPHLGPLAVPAMLIAIAAAGLLNGLIIVAFQMPSFIATVGTLGLWSGVSLVVSSASAVSVTGGYRVIAWLNGNIDRVPVSFLFAIAVMTVLGGVLTLTPVGRLALYAVGLAEPAAQMSGVRVAIVKVLCFAAAGLFSGLTALVLVAQDISGDPTSANSLLLPSIAAVVVGGNAITGGTGGMSRVLIGALIITVVQNGIGVMGINPFYEQIVYGVILVAAAGLTLDRSAIGVLK